MTDRKTEPTLRSDYRVPDFLVESIELEFDLGETETIVRSLCRMRRNPDSENPHTPLVLDGKRLQLLSITLDNEQLAAGQYQVTAESLTIPAIPDSFTIEIRTAIRPQENTFLEGLYRSGGIFCTQCEAEGFRTITYYPDRPDVMAIFTTTIIADKSACPVLLSNGNPIARGDLDNNRHFAKWHDPFRKPCYLFALVAGDLACSRDSFTTCSGRAVSLELYVHPKDLHKCSHALASLKRAMKWDEDVYGREYDLDIYMIVAVDDFNMGAMENKGLNVFNSRYVLATPETATDDDYHAIEEVIAHEYFHNWSGNRVTCRDWFQLSLKEGLTVFRDQEFSADMQSRGVKRINDVRCLRTSQFQEDSGPLAHPVRPDSYIEINNFYTATVYNKGAEVVRMIHTLLGTERFRKGMDLYFERHDGAAVTVDHFLKAMEDASAIDLQQFSRWYAQSGTPHVQASGSYNQATQTFNLKLSQSTPATPGQTDKQPFLIPIGLTLLAPDGSHMELASDHGNDARQYSQLLSFSKNEEEFCFRDIPAAPVPVLLRGFSAPVKISYPYSRQELTFVMTHEDDPFARWEASQELALNTILALVKAYQTGEPLRLEPDFSQAYRNLLTSGISDKAFLAETLTLPSEQYIAEQMSLIDPLAIHTARRFLLRSLAENHREALLNLRNSCHNPNPYSPDDNRSGERRLANLCLQLLCLLEDEPTVQLAGSQLQDADNMTDAIAALSALASCHHPLREQALSSFYDKWQHDRQVIDKWFTVQAFSSLPDTLERVQALTLHPAFELSNPNRFRALIGAFSQNQARFHASDGSGYHFFTEQIIRLIPLNPQVSARLLTPLSRWRRFESHNGALMRQQLERIARLTGLPKDVYEIVSRSLADQQP